MCICVFLPGNFSFLLQRLRRRCCSASLAAGPADCVVVAVVVSSEAAAAVAAAACLHYPARRGTDAAAPVGCRNGSTLAAWKNDNITHS